MRATASAPVWMPLLLMACAGAVSAQITTPPIYSNAAEDGWVRSAPLAFLDAASVELRLGDHLTNRQYVGVMSFDTGAFLPPTAVVQSAELHLRRGTSVTPPTWMGTAFMTIKTGSFSGSSALQTSDLTDNTGTVNAGTLVIGAANGDFSTSPLNAAGCAAINVTGLTQIRIEYPTGTDGNSDDNYHVFSSSDDPVAGYHPYLVITYLGPTPTPTASPSASASASPTSSPSATSSPSPSPSPPATSSPSPSPSATEGPSPTASPSPSPQGNSASDWELYE